MNTFRYASNNGLSNFDKLGLDDFGISIEMPNADDVDGDTLNLTSTGHTFAWLKNDSGQLESIYSYGPSDPHNVHPSNVYDFLKDGIGSKVHFNIFGQVLSWSWHLNPTQSLECMKQFQYFSKMNDLYTPKNQCTSKSILLARACGIDVPNGISPVRFWAGIYHDKISNPLGLSIQLSKSKRSLQEDSKIYQEFNK